MAEHNVSLGETLSLTEAPSKGIGKQLADLLRLADALGVPFQDLLTQAQTDLLSGFRFNFPNELQDTQDQQDDLKKQRAEWKTIDNTYVAGQKGLMKLLGDRLLLKIADRQRLQPDPDGDGLTNIRTVVYDSTHPNKGGKTPSAWKVVYEPTRALWDVSSPFVSTAALGEVKSTDGLTTYLSGVDYTSETDPAGTTTLTNLLIPPGEVHVFYVVPPQVEDYSHTVNWDNDPLLQDYETGWTEYFTARFDQAWGSVPRINSLDSAVNIFGALLTLLTGRDHASKVLGLKQYVVWDTSKLLTHRHSAVVVKSLDGKQTFTPGVDYTIRLDKPDLGDKQLKRVAGSPMPDTVRVEAA